MMHRNGYYLPSKNSSIITINWMLDVKEGNEWCPKYIDVKLRPCVDRPLKCYILNELCKELMAHNLKLTFDKSHTADVDWLIVCLSTLNPEHRYFKKDYIPTRAELKQPESEPNEESKSIYEISSEDDSFFQNMPYETTFAKSKNTSRYPLKECSNFFSKQNCKMQSENPNERSHGYRG